MKNLHGITDDVFNDVPRFAIPIPNFRAEEAARDLASDIRKLGVRLMPLEEARERGEKLSHFEEEERKTLRAEIQGMAQTVFLCVDTQKTFRVGDYVSKRREMLAALRLWKIATAWKRVRQVFQ